ncbi:MAG: hypothetical protein ACSHWU_08220 [Marinicella sp.]
MKLTEKQLAEVFKNHSKKHTSTSDASDCLGATAASSNRISHVEDIANDHTGSAAMKVALSLKDWSQVLGQSIENTRQSWFSFLGMGSPMKTALATVTFAFAFAVALPEFSKLSQQEPMHIPISHDVVSHDIINAMKFEENSDQIMKFSDDGERSNGDSLFRGNFG